MQSKELTEFYKGYVQWVEDGAPEGTTPYARWHGLCNAAWRFMDGLEHELIKQFHEHGLDKATPFNDSFSAYNWEGDDNMMHLNLLRLQWCKDRIKEAEG